MERGGYTVATTYASSYNINWETLPTGNFQKTTFQSLKSCFLIFPSRHPWEQAVSFSGAFPAAQSAIAITGKFQKTTFQSLKSCFGFSPPDTLESRQWAFQVLFQLPKAQLQWETLPTGKLKKNKFSEPEKLFFDFPLQKIFRGRESFATAPPPVTCLNPPGPTKTERTPNFDGTRRGNRCRI